MATPLTDSINALTAYANETTGKQDTTLSDAVESLVEGYGGGIKKSEYRFTPTTDVYVYKVSVEESEDSILFAHWYDATPNIYPTNNIAYEGIHIGKAICKYTEYAENPSWHMWRTNASGTTGPTSYGTGNKLYDNGIRVCNTVKFITGHEYILEIYYV